MSRGSNVVSTLSRGSAPAPKTPPKAREIIERGGWAWGAGPDARGCGGRPGRVTAMISDGRADPARRIAPRLARRGALAAARFCHSVSRGGHAAATSAAQRRAAFWGPCSSP
jgi:hypothetical protein